MPSCSVTRPKPRSYTLNGPSDVILGKARDPNGAMAAGLPFWRRPPSAAACRGFLCGWAAPPGASSTSAARFRFELTL
eukprot:scaffold3493_cov84-Isochrysis_galbana.AAC.4